MSKKAKKPAYSNREEQYAAVLRSMPPLPHTPTDYDSSSYDICTQSEVVAWLHDNLSPRQIDQALFDFCTSLKGALPDGSERLPMVERITQEGRVIYRGVPRRKDGNNSSLGPRPEISLVKLNDICEICCHCTSPGVCDRGNYGRDDCPDFG